MFDTFQQRLQVAFKSLRGKGKLTEANMREGLSQVETALLEADVSHSVIQKFMADVTEKALGENVLRSLDPSQQLVGIVHQELLEILGPGDPSLHLRGEVTVIMLCGLQGSGKTTTCGKLARLIKRENRDVLLTAADLQRPAAIDQLHVLGEQVGVPVYSERDHKDPVKVCRNAVREARSRSIPVVLLDTAGRLAIDQELMDELKRIDNKVQPDQCYLVVDGMTGQDAVNSAAAFNKALELDGVVMTKLDGDARGGALLSVREVTGVPVKFIGTGEGLDGLEPFRPEGMAERILGMGDIVGLVQTAQQEFDREEAQKAEERLKSGEFTLDDFRKQLSQIEKPGLMQKMLGMMPGMGQIKEMMGGADGADEIKQLRGIIDSMTPAERRNPRGTIDPSRRVRIANGAGVQPQQVNELVKQYDGMKSMMEKMAGKGMRERMQMMQEMQSGGMLDPSGKIKTEKQSTGKRLSSKERAKLRKQRDKELRRKKREARKKK